MTKECYQIGFIETSLKSASSSVTLDNLFFICLHSRHFYHKPYNQGTQGRCVRSKKQHTSPDLYAFWKRYTRGASQLHSVQIVSTFWTLHVMHTKGLQLRWSKYNLNLFTEALLKKFSSQALDITRYLWRTDPHFCTTPKLHRSPSRSVVWSPDHTLSQGETVWWTQSNLLGWFTLFVTVSPCNVQNILRKTHSRKVWYFNGDE